MKYSRVFWSLALAASVLAAGQRTAAETKPAKEINSFGAIKAPAVETVRASALDWLKSVKGDEAKFDLIWKNEDLTTLDKVTETFVLGSPEAAKLLSEARNAAGAAPKELPALLRAKDATPFFRSNLALAYAKALANRRLYEDSLEALKEVKVEQVVDPASYYFHKAVAEHGLENKAEASKTIAKLIDDVSDAPERYRMVAALMVIDMASWQEKGLGKIAKLMGTAERRLEAARGGPKTQEVEREIIRRLEEEIKKLENQAKGSGAGNGGSCPDGGQPGDGKPGDNPNASSPQKDSMGGNAKGPGKVDPKDFENKAAKWGDLPEKDRPTAIKEAARNLPPGTRRLIEEYYRKQAAESTGGK